MAIELKLFERVESGKGLFAVESISLIYNALTTILILLLYPRMDHPGMMLLERLGIVVLTFVLIYLYQAFPCRLTAFIRMVVQMSLLAYWYPDTFEFNRFFSESRPCVCYNRAVYLQWATCYLVLSYIPASFGQ